MIEGGGSSGYSDVKVYVLFAGKRFENDAIKKLADQFTSIHLNTSLTWSTFFIQPS